MATDGSFVAPTGKVEIAACDVAVVVHTIIIDLEKLENYKVKSSLGSVYRETVLKGKTAP